MVFKGIHISKDTAAELQNPLLNPLQLLQLRLVVTKCNPNHLG